RRRDRREDAEPRERVMPFVSREHAGRDRRARDAVKPIAAGDESAAQLARGALVAVTHARVLALDALELHVLDVELDLAAAGEPRPDQVLHDLLLSVDRERASAGELGERDTMAVLIERDHQTVVNQ